LNQITIKEIFYIKIGKLVTYVVNVEFVTVLLLKCSASTSYEGHISNTGFKG